MGVVPREEWEILLKDKVKTCPRCDKHFCSHRSMMRHLTSVHVKNKHYPCDECGKLYSGKANVQMHKKKVHRGMHFINNLECHYCGCLKTNKSILRDHIYAHMGIKPYHCSTCGMNFSLKKTLKRHIEKHKKKNHQPLIEDHQVENMSPEEYKNLVKNKVKDCPKCKKEFSTPRYMRKHLRDIHSAQKCHICDQCGNQYKTKSSLSEHKRFIHSEKRPLKKEQKFECNVCESLFATKYTLRDHMNTHTGKKFICDMCGRGFSSTKHLKRHKLYHLKQSGQLPDINTHQCQICDKFFIQKHALRHHMDWVHGDKHHLCKICGAKIKGTLQQHMMTHTGEKKYCCHICGKKMRGKLREHMLTHTGERPYACDCCGSTFKDKSYLKIHMRKHSGERPYVCNHCEHSFAARSAFTLHLKKHSHLDQTIECEYCHEHFSTKLRLKEHLKTHFC